MDKIKVAEKFKIIGDYWNPRIIGELNGQMVKLVKVKGEFIWHHHDNEDELFFVLKGKLKMEFRGKTEVIYPGEMVIVPRGVEHRPVADEETEIMLFEPAATLNTGNIQNERTRAKLDRL